MPPVATSRRLAPSEFAFHGFNGLMAEVEQRLHAVEIRGGEPAVAVVEDAVFVPGAKVQALDRGPGRFTMQGALVTSDGQPIELAQARRQSFRWGAQVRGGVAGQTAIEPSARVDEDVVYLGWFFEHFGHFLTESLVRTWFLKKIDPSVKVVFHRKPRHAPVGITKRILGEFGIPPDRMLFFDQPTRLRRVIVPEPLYELSCSAHERMTEPFREIAARYVGRELTSDQPVYLSRRLLPSHLRQVVGEDELEEILRKNGFRIAYPETMTFEDQIRLFNQHRDIFTSAGSAAYNVLFALNQPTLHFLTSGIPREDFFLAPTTARATAAFCNCFGRGGRPALNTTPLLAETTKFVAYLDDRGFLRSRLRASLAGCGSSARERYDEAWLYAAVRDVPQEDSLPDKIQREAGIVARGSWPVSWMLAQYHAVRDSSPVEALVRQFIELVSAEPSNSRLAQHHKDIESKARQVAKSCTPATADRLRWVLANRFLVEIESKQRRRGRTPGENSR